MSEPSVSDLFLAAAAIEAETPITIGANIQEHWGRRLEPHIEKHLRFINCHYPEVREEKR